MMPSTPTALVFDWGDTLMRVFPEYQGAMVDWPRVEAVEGAAEALQKLHGRYRLFVATNAANSSAAQVQAALDRVGLAGFFEQVFTMHELGSRKPAPGFFTALSETIAEKPADCVMIGDELKADVLGPLQAGWRSIWFNPTNQPAPGLVPLHGGDIDHLADLPGAVEHLDLPRIETCLIWLLQNTTALNLLQHQLSVGAVAYLMALWMRANGTQVEPILAQRGGLLHDIGKITPQKEGENLPHNEAGARALEALGEPALAQITRRHQLYSLNDPELIPTTWEQKLVYFADKMVEKQAGLMTAQERIERLRQRYNLNPHQLDQLMPRLLALQEELCRRAGVPEDELIPRLKAAFISTVPAY